MAIPTDPVAVVEARIWTILLASADFTNDETGVRAMNRLRNDLSAKERNLDPRTARAPKDTPTVEIVQGNYTSTPYRGTKTFGTFDPSAAPARIVDRTQDFTIKILTDDEGTAKARALAWLVEDLLTATPQLGIPAIVRLVENFNATTQVTNQGKAAGVMRRLTTITFRVSMRQNVPAP